MSDDSAKLDKLVQQHIDHAEQAMLREARQRLAGVVDSGQYERDYASDQAVYAMAKAFCVLYERLKGLA